MRTQPARRIVRGGVALLGVALAAMIAMHLPPIRGYLAARGHTGGGMCPAGFGPQTAAGAAAQRARRVALRGSAPARSRPALGFALDQTTAADVARWAAQHGVACTRQHGGTLVQCRDVPGALVPDAGDHALAVVWFQLDGRGTLSAIRTMRRDRAAAPVAAMFATAQRTLTAQVGAPARRDGSAAPEELSQGALRQASIEYRFADYRAVVRATNMGADFLLTEEYATLVD